MKEVFRRYKKPLNGAISGYNARLLFVFCILFTMQSTAIAQQIIPDGQTATTLNTNINTTEVTTTTIKGSNAFNSFKRFNVNEGNKVNLVVPDETKNLINLIHSEKSYIDGTLNSLKNGQIGGTIFLVNPHGITVGPQGVVNVGKLNAITPTKEYMDSFFTTAENPDDNSINALLNGNCPINSSASIENHGTINAIEGVRLDAGNIINTGVINSNQSAKNEIDLYENILNVGDLESEDDLTINDNNIILKATEDINISGKISGEGTNNINGSNITITSDNNIVLEEDSCISSSGNGINSNAGEIYIYAQENASIENNATIEAKGGNISGNGGFIEFSAGHSIDIDGAIFKANANNGEDGEVLIDPEIIIMGSLLSDGVDMNFIAGDYITVGNDVIVSSRNLITAATGEDVSAEDHSNCHYLKGILGI